jgi:hypothetical protein
VVVRTVAREEAYRAKLQHGLLAGLCALAACVPNAGLPRPGDSGTATVAPTGFCVKPKEVCSPDPGAPPVNCAAAEAGLEFLAPFKIADFEYQDATKGFIGQYMYSYTDATAQVYANRDGTQALAGFEPLAQAANVCTSDAANHVLHISGGPFLGWGGGIGVAMEHFTQTDNGWGKGLCPWGDPPRYDFCPPPDGDEGGAISMLTVDMTKWDGVAVWARRGPDSQPLLRVLVANKYTDDDVSYKQYLNGDPREKRFCERVRECGCSNGKPCQKWEGTDAGDQGYYCWDPATDSRPMTTSGNAIQATNKCYVSRCQEEYPAYPGSPDPQFANRPCTPYVFRNGTQGSYCWDPDPNHRYRHDIGTLDPNGVPDSPPAEPNESCGDFWTFPLHLTTEWQLYLVPFTTMYQQGWAKRWPFFDTASVSTVRLTWDAGWIDYWVDNLRFYRVRRSPDAGTGASK